ncbi:hypothetical protein MKW94_007333, partial [Papaver nudicaule]|nr:hypothetical protein [Papaver nudicaule]
TDLMEELRTMTLESPFRSTLKDTNTSSSVLLNPDDIKKDLATLRWNEWSIDSIRIHRSGLLPGQSSIKSVEPVKKSSRSAALKKKKNKKVLTDISNLPAASLESHDSSNSKPKQAKKKIRSDSDSSTVQKNMESIYVVVVVVARSRSAL